MRPKGWWISLVIISLVLSSASAQQLALEGITSVKISYHNPRNKVPVSAKIFHTFPAWEVSEIADTISATKKAVWLRCPVRTEQEGEIFIHNMQIPLLMIPGDTISISLSGSPERPNVEFEGKTKDVQQYYMARKMRFPIPVSQLMMNAGIASPNLKEFTVQADSLYSLDQQFWDGYKQKLSAWFIRYESDAIRYRNAQLRLYALTYQMFVQHKPAEIPKEYFKFLETTPFQNEAAMYDF